MEFDTEEGVVCRVCLKLLKDTRAFGFIHDDIGTLRDILMMCIPEVDIYVSSDPVVCLPCIRTLMQFYNFKRRCHNTETIINNYIKLHNLTRNDCINLNFVVNELSNNNTLDGDEIRGGHTSNDVPSIPATNNSNFQRENYDNNNLSLSNFKCEIPKVNFQLQNENLSNNTQYLNDSMKYPKFFNSQQTPPFNKRLNHHSQSSDIRNVPEQRAAYHQEFQKFSHTTSQIQIPSNSYQIYRAPMRFSVESLPESQSINNVEPIMPCTESHVPPIESPVNSLLVKFGQPTESTENDRIEHEEIEIKDEEIEESCKEETPSKNVKLMVRIPRALITIPFHKECDGEKKDLNNVDSIEDENNGNCEVKDASMDHDGLNVEGKFFYECFKCAHKTSSKDAFIKHRDACKPVEDVSVSHEQTSECTTCIFTPIKPDETDEHTTFPHNEINSFQCERCTYRSSDFTSLYQHVNLIHKGLTYNCNFCSYFTSDKSNFRKHLFTHYPDKLQCDFCDHQSTSPYRLRMHLRKFHDGVGVEDVDLKKGVSLQELTDSIAEAVKNSKKYTL